MTCQQSANDAEHNDEYHKDEKSVAIFDPKFLKFEFDLTRISMSWLIVKVFLKD